MPNCTVSVQGSTGALSSYSLIATKEEAWELKLAMIPISNCQDGNGDVETVEVRLEAAEPPPGAAMSAAEVELEIKDKPGMKKRPEAAERAVLRAKAEAQRARHGLPRKG